MGIDDVTFEIKKGEIYGFIGPNGAGKSTTIKLLLNMIFPNSGSAKVLDLDVVEKTNEIKKVLGYVPSDVRYYSHLTPKQLLKTTLEFHKINDTIKINEICETLDIDPNKKIGELSMGNKKKVAIAAALIHSPEVIILDEPTNGLDPLIQKKLFELLKDCKNNGATIFLSSHNLTEVEAHCDRVAFIKNGKILKVQALGENIVKSKIITIKASNFDKNIFSSLGAKIIFENKNTIKFSFNGDTNKLIASLSTLKIDDVLIENSSIEDEFIEYYEGELKWLY